MYDIDKFRYYLHGTAFGFILLGNLLDIGVIIYANRIRNLYDDDETDDIQLENKNDDYSEGEEDDEWEKFQQKVNKKEKVLETKSKQSHSVHCPYFPDDKQEYWWIYIADKKRHALMTIPYLMTNLVDREEVELKFTAPIKPGIYSYSVIVRSDSYVDFDLSKLIRVSLQINILSRKF